MIVCGGVMCASKDDEDSGTPLRKKKDKKGFSFVMEFLYALLEWAIVGLFRWLIRFLM